MLALNAETLAEQPAAGEQPLLSNLVEWQRIELLCLCLLNAKEGPGDALLGDLKQCQQAVLHWRTGDFWQVLGLENDLLAQDLLAFAGDEAVDERAGAPRWC